MKLICSLYLFIIKQCVANICKIYNKILNYKTRIFLKLGNHFECLVNVPLSMQFCLYYSANTI